MKLHVALLASLVLALALTVAGVDAQADAPRLLGESTVADSSLAKFPRVAAVGESVYLAANTARLNASLFSRPAQADAFGPAERLGPAEGHPDYSTATVTATPDGRLVYVWINQPQRTIYARVRARDGQWGPAAVVSSRTPFPVYVAAAATDGEMVIVWRDPDRPVVFSRSTDGGRSWASPVAVSARAGVNAPAIAAGPGGTIAVAYTQEDAGRLQVFAGLWNGRSFDVRRVSSTASDFADPGVAVLADGRAAVSYRGVAETGDHSGVFYAERAPDGGWPVARLIAGKVIGPVAAAGDPQGGLSLLWIGAARRQSQVWLARRQAGGAWSTPAGSQAVADGAIFNVHGVTASAGGLLYAHAASELFIGDRTVVRGYRFLAGSGGGPGAVSARPVIEGGAAGTRAATLAVSFEDVVGLPTEVRWRWDGPPTDADPWQPFATTISVAPPPDDACGERTLFTQVRGAVLQARPASDSITLDRAVQAVIRHRVTESAPGSTNQPSTYLSVDGAADCSGISMAGIVGGPPARAISAADDFLRADLLAAGEHEGPREIAVALADRLGNTGTFTTTIIYDRTPPTVSVEGPFTVEVNPRATILQTLRLAGVRFADQFSAAPWALKVTVSAGPAALSGIAGTAIYPIRAEQLIRNTDGTYTIAVELNLATALRGHALAPTTYAYTALVLDAAGNPGSFAVETELALDAVTYPKVGLPLVRR